MQSTRQTIRIVACVALAALALSACGDDDTDDATPPGDSTPATEVDFCEAALAIEVVPDPELDFETATEDEIIDAVSTFGREVMRPLADDIVASAPDEVADEVAALSDAVDEIAGGNPEAFDEPEIQAIERDFGDFVDDECGWTSIDVTAADYSFTGLPDEIDAGTVRFWFDNEGSEFHEVLLLQRNPGAELPVEELMELSEEEAFALVTPAGPPVLAPPGGSDMGVYELTEGEYIAICMIPTGITSEDSEPAPDAPPHAAHGMVVELSVV